MSAALEEIQTAACAHEETEDPIIQALRRRPVFKVAMDLFKDEDAARRWMTSPARALGEITPLECSETEAGAFEVKLLLMRIAHGVFT